MDQLTDLPQRDAASGLSMEIVFGWMKIPAITVWERLYAPHRARLDDAGDFHHYDVRGRSLEGLPTRSNGLPAPLTRTVVDTSLNPGRRVLRNGYVEAVSSPMWLGASFWSLVGRNKEDVCGMDGWQCVEFENGVTRIDVPGGTFTSADSPSGDLQRRLRAALYPA